MRIYTRTGDDGETGLLGPVRVFKDHIRIEAYGQVDELNAQMGALRAHFGSSDIASEIESIQRLLFEAGGELAQPAGTAPLASRLGAADVASMERAIDRLEADLPPLTNFILPGGCPASAAAHIARCVCRRAERAAVRLMRSEPESETEVLRFLNRLSDYLFVLARWANHRAGVPETIWHPRPTDSGAAQGGTTT